MKIRLLALICAVAVTNVDAASAIKMHSVTDYIQNIKKVIDDTKSQTTLPVIFPAKVPLSKDPLYANGSGRSDFWAINVDANLTCNGAHYCNIGLMSAQERGRIDETYFNMETKSKQKKSMIKLANGNKAWFTPGHAEADWHNPTLEWKSKDIVYTLTWTINNTDEKQVLTTMANSAIS